MSVVQEVLASLIRVVADHLDESKEEEVILYYSGADFKGQDYALNKSEDLYLGDFKVPLSDENGKHKGWIKWDSSAVKPEVTDDEWSVLEQVNISLGKEHNDPVWLGAALSKAKKGYYNLNRAYEFHLMGSEGKKKMTIRKIDDNQREVRVKRHQGWGC
tara:strand:- start:312 stop:788 length:477 start_codon:yes stop_codon:yes gene_type:complete